MVFECFEGLKKLLPQAKGLGHGYRVVAFLQIWPFNPYPLLSVTLCNLRA
jgi:hypothetical protein